MNNNQSRRGRYTASAAAAVLLAGLTLGVAGCGPDPGPTATGTTASSTSAAAPAPAASSPAAVSTPQESSTPAPTSEPAPVPPAAQPLVTGPVMDASAPVSLGIPDIGLTTNLLTLGQEANGETEVPPVEVGSPAGWYKFSPTPGSLGPSVILGHVNTTTTPDGVFFRLRDMTPGQQFSVTRADGQVAVFAVDHSEIFKKNAFPTLAVYGNTERAEIRLITCDGYDPATGEFTENMVVYGHLVSSHAA